MNREEIKNSILEGILKNGSEEEKNLIENYYEENVLFETKLVGATFENRQKIFKFLVDKKLTKDINIVLEREPDNKYDKNAIKIIANVKGGTKTQHMGYIDRNLAKTLTSIMNKGINIEVTENEVTGIEQAHYGMRLVYKLI